MTERTLLYILAGLSGYLAGRRCKCGGAFQL